MLHIYTETIQPATGWTDTHSEEPMQMGFRPEKLIYAHCCGKKRMEKNCVVQSYYDGLSIWCAQGHGCNNPQVIAAKKWKQHMNRSRAQRARREREKAEARMKVLRELECKMQLGFASSNARVQAAPR